MMTSEMPSTRGMSDFGRICLLVAEGTADISLVDNPGQYRCLQYLLDHKIFDTSLRTMAAQWQEQAGDHISTPIFQCSI